MRSSRRLASLLVAPLLVVSLLGCPGSAKFKRDGRSDTTLTPLPDSYPIVISDLSTSDSTVVGEGTVVKKDATTPAQDLALSSVPGDPCPCKPPLLCVKAACRLPCTQLVCNGSSCNTAEACVMTTAGTPVCIPAVGVGAACSSSIFCATGTMCLGTGNTGKCYTTCTGPRQPCASCTALPTICSYCP
jgi:hypothetical protein